MAFSDIRDEIVTILKTVTGIGRVNEFARHTTFLDEVFSRYIKNGKLNYWEVTRTQADQRIRAVQNANGNEPLFFDTHQVMISGFLSLNDDLKTENTFQALVDNVVAKFRVTNLLNGKVILPRFAQVPTIGHRKLTSILVHFAEITFEAIEPVGG